MNCSNIILEQTKFLISRSFKNVTNARQYCKANGYNLANINKSIEKELKKFFDSCNVWLVEFIADQVKDDENPNCYLLYLITLDSDDFETISMCDEASKYNFLCSKSAKPTSTTEVSNINQINSNRVVIITVSIIFIVALLLTVLGFFLIKKLLKTRRNVADNVEMQPVASTSVNKVCFDIKYAEINKAN